MWFFRMIIDGLGIVGMFILLGAFAHSKNESGNYFSWLIPDDITQEPIFWTIVFVGIPAICIRIILVKFKK